ncbi:MAG: hypothetical protein WC934_11310, partial [Acidithiobacillus sp.]|uniref:hypothetical protein n=1 Tax=Acidithiobacillus sp. TaxID=1872118 RepID=UPI0035600D6F
MPFAEKFKYEIDDSDLKLALSEMKELSKSTDKLMKEKGDFFPDITKLNRNVGRLAPSMEKFVDKFREQRDITKEMEDILERVGNVDQQYISNEDIKLMNDVVMDVAILGKKLEKNKKISNEEAELLLSHQKTLEHIEGELENRKELEDLIFERVKETKKYQDQQLKVISKQREEYKKMLREKGLVGGGLYGKAKASIMARRDIEGPDVSGAEKAIGRMSKMFSGLGGVISKAFGPLLALFTISEFLQYDKKVKDQRKELTKMAAESGLLYKNMSKLSFSGGRGEIEKIRLSLDNLLGDLRVSSEESQDAMNSMIDSGFTMEEALGNTIKQSDTLSERMKKTGNIISGALDLVAQEGEYTLSGIKSIYEFSTLTGQSLQDAAKMAGDWKMQLGVVITDTNNLFVKMTKDASSANYQTSKFFDKVMQMSNEMVIYGNKIEQTSDAFGDLMKSMNLPKEVSAELASEMLTNVKQMDDSQKAFISNVGNAEDKLIKQIEDRRKQSEEVYSLIVDARKNGNEEEANALEKRKQTIDDEVTLYNKILKIPDNLSRSIRMLEALDPGKQFEAQIEAMVNSLNIKDELGNVLSYDELKKMPDKLADIFENNTAQLDAIGSTFGMNQKQVRSFSGMFIKFSQNIKRLTEIEEKYGKNSDEYINAAKELPTTLEEIGRRDKELEIQAAKEAAKAQIRTIKEGNTPITDGLTQIFDVLQNKIYVSLVGIGTQIIKALNMLPGIDVRIPDFDKALEILEENREQLTELENEKLLFEKTGKDKSNILSERLEYASILEDINRIKNEEKYLKQGDVERVNELRNEILGSNEIANRNQRTSTTIASGYGISTVPKNFNISSKMKSPALQKINQAILDSVEKNINREYEFGKKGKGAGGIDCSGFVELLQDDIASNVFNETNKKLKDRSAAGQILAANEIDLSELQPGDIIGVDASSRKGFGKKGVDHILQVFANQFGELMVAESKQGKGV